MNEEILNQVFLIVKAIGGKAVLEVVKSKWVQFCIGASLLGLSYEDLIVKVIKVLYG